MPLYEYKCNDCGTVFEELIGKTVPESFPACPKCRSDNCQRQFSTFAAKVGIGSSGPACSTGGCGGGGGFT